MPDIVSDIVDVYVFRRLNARVQFLLLQRRANVPLGNTWQSFHTQIQGYESTIEAGQRAVRELAGLTVSEVYSADYINEFFDDTRDVVVLAPVLAVNVSPQAPVTLGPELKECAWWDTNQAIARLPFAGQRWAVRHINELMSAGLAESQLYRLQLPEEPRLSSRAVLEEDAAATAIDESDGAITAADVEEHLLDTGFDGDPDPTEDGPVHAGDETAPPTPADGDTGASPSHLGRRTDVPVRDE
ncbi:MAG: NUDIX domain-containing protein [Chloroflexota bacterium]|nr:NUDIX domain-containing protein [Chloroflexota bacterium]